jgi:hypothetical protein
VPRSTEQVLHPEKYLADEGPETITLPDLGELRAAGFRAVLEETLGELELGVYLGTDAPSGVDRAAAAGWAGDRLRLYEGPTGHAVVWFCLWDSEADAAEALAATRRAADPGTVRQVGRALLFTRGLPAALQAPVDSAFATFATTVASAAPPR